VGTGGGRKGEKNQPQKKIGIPEKTKKTKSLSGAYHDSHRQLSTRQKGEPGGSKDPLFGTAPSRSRQGAKVGGGTEKKKNSKKNEVMGENEEKRGFFFNSEKIGDAEGGQEGPETFKKGGPYTIITRYYH